MLGKDIDCKVDCLCLRVCVNNNPVWIYAACGYVMISLVILSWILAG